MKGPRLASCFFFRKKNYAICSMGKYETKVCWKMFSNFTFNTREPHTLRFIRIYPIYTYKSRPSKMRIFFIFNKNLIGYKLWNVSNFINCPTQSLRVHILHNVFEYSCLLNKIICEVRYKYLVLLFD